MLVWVNKKQKRLAHRAIDQQAMDGWCEISNDEGWEWNQWEVTSAAGWENIMIMFLLTYT